MKSGPWAPTATVWKSGLSGADQNRGDDEDREKGRTEQMIDWPGSSVCVCACVSFITFELTFATSCGKGKKRGGKGVENGEPCHVFMLTNELITQPLIYLSLCHFTGMLQQSNACRLWVISWQLKANYSSNSTTHQALNHKCCSLSICLFLNLLSRNWASGFRFTLLLQHLPLKQVIDRCLVANYIFIEKLGKLCFPCEGCIHLGFSFFLLLKR